MKLLRRTLLVGALAGAVLARWPLLAQAAAPSSALDGAPSPDDPKFAEWVMTRVDDQYRGEKSHGIMTMYVKTKHFERSMAMESWSLGTENSLIRILAPKKEKGNATLKAGKDLFTYLSKTGRTIKITGGMMGASWMGSHFTNDDLVKESRLSDDFVIKLTGRGTASGEDTYHFTLTARPDAAVVWGKIEVVVRQKDLQPVSQVFYDEDGEKVRSMEFSGHKTIGDRTLPTIMTIRPLDGSGEYTRVEYKKLDFSPDIDASFFSLQRLKSL